MCWHIVSTPTEKLIGQWTIRRWHSGSNSCIVASQGGYDGSYHRTTIAPPSHHSSIEVRPLGLGPELAQINLQIAFIQHYIYIYQQSIESQSMSLEYIGQSIMFPTTVIFVTTLQLYSYIAGTPSDPILQTCIV